mgnify:CR=1 FL=1
MRDRGIAALTVLALAGLAGCGEERVVSHEIRVRASPVELDFGIVPVGSSRRLAIVFENEGRSAVALQLQRAPADVSIDSSLVRIPAQGRARVEVTFRPTDERSLEEVLRFEGGGSGVEVGVRGRALVHPIEVAEVVDFGTVRVGGEEARNLLIRNRTDERLLVTAGIGAAGAVENFRFEPAEISLDPRSSATFPVVYRPRRVGRHEASLDVLCVGFPASTVRLQGRGQEVLLSVEPAPIVFDRMEPGEFHEIRVVVENAGEVTTGPIAVVVADERFTLDRTGLRSLEPGERDEFAIRHLASWADPVIESELRLRGDNGSVFGTIPIVARLEGTSIQPSAPARFAAPVGWNGLDPYVGRIEVRNLGLAPEVGISATVTGQDGRYFEIWPEEDGRVRGGEPTAFLVAFHPIRPGQHQATVVFHADLEEVSLPIQGWGNLPVAECPEIPPQVPVLTELALTGGDASVLADAACEWTLVEAPGFLTDDAFPKGCTIQYRPTLVGDYLFELKLTDRAGNVDTCRVGFEASPDADLWVETFWDEPSDVDLYVLNLALGDPNVREHWVSPAACFFYNCQSGSDPLPWGPKPDNSPHLNVDDTRGRGPENIHVRSVPTPAAYAFGVHWFNNRKKPSTRATVSVYCYGERQVGLQVELDRAWVFHRLGTIAFPELGRCEVEIDPVVWDDFLRVDPPGGE